MFVIAMVRQVLSLALLCALLMVSPANSSDTQVNDISNASPMTGQSPSSSSSVVSRRRNISHQRSSIGSSARFRELFQLDSAAARYDPIVRHSTCPQGCIAAPRGPGALKDDSGGLAMTPMSQSQRSKSSNSRSSHGSSGHAHKAQVDTHEHDDAKDLQAHPSSPRCPHGCLEAPDL